MYYKIDVYDVYIVFLIASNGLEKSGNSAKLGEWLSCHHFCPVIGSIVDTCSSAERVVSVKPSPCLLIKSIVSERELPR